MIVIAVPDSNDSIVKITLEEKVYYLHFSYSSLKSWTFGIYDKNNKPVVDGIRIVPNYPLTHQYGSSRTPTGEFVCTVQDDSVKEISRQDFLNKKAFFVYVSEAEINGL